MRFSILGPLHVEIEGAPIDIRRPRWRSILAYLLLQANRPITTDQLITAVWGDRPVPTANTQVHAAVSVLRRTFRRAGAGDIIENPPTGYLVSLHEAQLDVFGFTTAVSAARNGTGTPDDLRQGLDLWRGPALDGINAAFVDAARARLEEERLFVFEKLMDSEITRGNGSDITPELMEFISLHPLRESLVERLMLALYRSGRKSDALREYTRIRERLTAELGVEPGPDLRRLHMEILQDGPTVQRKVCRNGRMRAVRGRPNIPRPSVVFTGRAAERAQLRYVLTGRRRGERTVVSLHGAAGVGKSALAIQAAHELSEDFPDGQLYVDLQGSSPGLQPLTEPEMFRLCLRGLGLAEVDVPAGEHELTRRYLELTDGAHLLILLDNAADSRQVRALLRATRTGSIIVTGRSPLTPPDSDLPLRIDVLPPADATALLDRVAGRAGADWAQLNQVAAYCDYLPLALCIAGGRLAREPDLSGARLAKSLTVHRDRLDALEVDGVGVSSSIRVGFDPIAAGRNPVDRVAASAFCALGLLPMSSIDDGVVSAMLCPEDPPLAAAALTRLARAQLVNPDDDGRYRPHDLVRAAAAEYAEESMSTSEQADLAHRAIDFYTACAVLAEDLLRPGLQRTVARPDPSDLVPSKVLGLVLRDAVDVDRWLDIALPNLVAVATMAAESPATARHAVTMGDALSWILRKRGDFQREHALAANAVVAADNMTDPAALRRALIHLGRVEIYLGNHSIADEHIDRALVSARADGDVYTQISAVNDLSLVAIKRGKLSTAKRLLRECVALATSQPSSARITVTALHNLAIVEALLEQWDAAARLLQDAIPLRHTTTDRAGEGSDRVLLGVVCCAMGELDEASGQLGEGIDICDAHGDRVNSWFGRAALTLVHLQQSRHIDATSTGQRCLLVARSIGQPYAEKSAHQLLAMAHDAAGEPAEAQAHRRRAEIIIASAAAPDARLIAALIAAYRRLQRR